MMCQIKRRTKFGKRTGSEKKQGQIQEKCRKTEMKDKYIIKEKTERVIIKEGQIKGKTDDGNISFWGPNKDK